MLTLTDSTERIEMDSSSRPTVTTCDSQTTVLLHTQGREAKPDTPVAAVKGTEILARTHALFLPYCVLFSF